MGFFQARILEWFAIYLSRGFSQTKDQTHVSCIGKPILYHWTTWEAHKESKATQNIQSRLCIRCRKNFLYVTTIVCPLYIYLPFIILSGAESEHSGSKLEMYLPPFQKIYIFELWENVKTSCSQFLTPFLWWRGEVESRKEKNTPKIYILGYFSNFFPWSNWNKCICSLKKILFMYKNPVCHTSLIFL